MKGAGAGEQGAGERRPYTKEGVRVGEQGAGERRPYTKEGVRVGEQGAGERRPYTKYWPVPFDDTIMERRCAMSSMLQGIQGETPEFLAIGHVTRDVHLDSGFSLGGTVTFAALTAYHLGLASAIVTCADPELVADLPGRLPEIGLAVRPSAMTTTFDNRYYEGFRTQYLRARGDDLDAEDVPAAWRGAPVVLLGPLAQELAPGFVSLFPRRSGAILAATPQGWLRRWDPDGRVWPTPWSAAETLLPNLDVLILSHDDLLPFADGNRAEADAILARWSHLVPLLVATDGRHGATLFQQGVATRFPAYATQEVDPTGAGDVFAAAFLTHLYKHHIPGAAVDFANCVASLSVEHEGTSGIPTMAQAMERVQARMER